MKKQEEFEQIEVFAGDYWQTGLVKSLLENAEIKVFVRDEIIGMLTPWWTAPGGAGSIRLFVAKTDYLNAKSIIDDYEKNINSED